MKKKENLSKQKNKGITLIALVITIIVLLILAGVTIATLTGDNGILTRATEAKGQSAIATEEEKIKLALQTRKIERNTNNGTSAITADELRNQLIADGEEEQNVEVTGESSALTVKYNDSQNEYIVTQEGNILDSSIKNLKVGDYIQYTPISNTYVPSENYNGTQTTTEITTENLNWRYWGMDKDGNLLIISENPTTSTVNLTGADGYNNGVNIIDDTCAALYNDNNIAKEVRNIKIEDIENVTKEEYKFNLTGMIGYGTEHTYTDNTKYPYLYEKEKGGKTDKGSTTGELDISDRGTPSQSGANTENISLSITVTAKVGLIVASNFTEELYYDCLLNNREISNHWVSTRGVYPLSSSNDSTQLCNFGINFISPNSVLANNSVALYQGNGTENSGEYALRPIVVLNPNVKVTEGNGEKDSPYMLEI